MGPDSRLILIFSLSTCQGPEAPEARSDLFSADSMSNFIAKVIAHFELETVHVLGPDIGTPIGLFLASRYSNKVKSVIVSGGAATYPLEVDNVLRDIIFAPDLEDFKKIPVKDIIDSSLSELKNYILPEEIRSDYINSTKEEDCLRRCKYSKGLQN